MKLSELRQLCDKAIEKYGDIPVGTYPAVDSYDVQRIQDMYTEIGFRVLSEGETNDLPGDDLSEGKPFNPQKTYFTCLFNE
jgi:hypothetical protein